jgi:ABC-type transporter MlaC component
MNGEEGMQNIESKHAHRGDSAFIIHHSSFIIALRRRSAFIIHHSPFIILFWLSWVAPARAGTALEYTRATLEQARGIVDSDRARNAKLDALSALLKDFLDTDAMGRAAVDRHWTKFSAAQQREFLTLFRELFQRTYVQKLLLFEKPDFAYVGEQPLDGDWRVDTKILTPRDEFAVTYRLHAAGDRWLATDIQIEDLSLTTNFRRQLDRLLTAGPVDNVLNRMRKKYGPGGRATDDEP